MIRRSMEYPADISGGGTLSWLEAGQGAPLVMLHGWSISGNVFTELAQQLSDEYRIFMPDLPGHGESTPLAQNTLASHGAVLSAWLRQEIAGPFSLLGWSLGGMLALALADDHRLDVQRLALLSATPRFSSDEEWSHGLPQTQVKALIRNLRRRFEATLGDFFALTFAGEEISDERMRQIRNFALRQSALPDKATAASLLELFLDQDQRALLDHLQLPTLVIHGELDQITPLAAGRYLAQQLPDSRFVEIAGVGHAPFLSRPDSVAAAIKDFC